MPITKTSNSLIAMLGLGFKNESCEVNMFNKDKTIDNIKGFEQIQFRFVLFVISDLLNGIL